MSLNPRLVRSRVDGRNCWVSFVFLCIQSFGDPTRNLQWYDGGRGGGGVPVTPFARGILFLFVFRKQKGNETNLHAKILGLKSIQSLNDDTTAVSYQFFYLEKPSFERSPPWNINSVTLRSSCQNVLFIDNMFWSFLPSDSSMQLFCRFVYTWRLLIYFTFCALALYGPVVLGASSRAGGCWL